MVALALERSVQDFSIFYHPPLSLSLSASLSMSMSIASKKIKEKAYLKKEKSPF